MTIHTPSQFDSIADFIAAAVAADVDVHKHADSTEGARHYCPEWEDGNIIMIADVDPSLLWFIVDDGVETVGRQLPGCFGKCGI